MNALSTWATSPLTIDLLLALGAALTLAAAWVGARAYRAPPRAPDHLARWLLAVRALRLGLSGLCLLGLGLGLTLGTAALTVPAIVIGLEELYETTAVITVLKRAQRQARGEVKMMGMRTLAAHA